MNKCKTCKYWIIPEQFRGALEIAAPLNPMDEWKNVVDVDEQRQLFGHAKT